MKKISVSIWVIVALFVTPLVFFQGCAAEKALKVEKSLPQSKLAYYNDSFDKLREDIWEKRAMYIPGSAARANFKVGDVCIEDGKLKVETKTGCFSRGGLATKYTIKGDFDIQLDCHIDFLEGQHDMDQMVQFCAAGKGKEIEAMDAVFMGLSKKERQDSGRVWSGYFEKGRYHPGNMQVIGNFHGTLRIVRIGNKISTFYKKEGNKGWKKLNTFRSTTDDVLIAFRLMNYHASRNSITARSPIIAKFDNFMINTAQEIIEEEI